MFKLILHLYKVSLNITSGIMAVEKIYVSLRRWGSQVVHIPLLVLCMNPMVHVLGTLICGIAKQC